MKKIQQGFTLIELMIVVAIIGILAAIAIPQYQTYVVKTQVTRAMGESGAMKTAVEACILGGKLTLPYTGAVNDCDPQATGSSILVGAVQDTTGAVVLPAGSGVPQIGALTIAGTPTITATFGNGAFNILAGAGASIVWSRSASGSWSCTSPLVPTQYKPAGCP